jgi:hypothetical protein
VNTEGPQDRPPKKVKSRLPHHQDRLSTEQLSKVRNRPNHTSASRSTSLRRRRESSRRLPVLESGYADPWRPQSPVAGYSAAAEHLIEHGLLPAADIEGMRQMWRRGGHYRRDAERIANAWGLSA